MDRYKFRGERLDNGEWAEGNLIRECTGECYIVQSFLYGEYGESVGRDWHLVDPATVGQAVTYYGKEFTTGDLISIPCHCDGEFGCSHGEGIYEFVYDANTAAYGLKYKGTGRFELLDNYDVDDMIIVGNRVDNPELLEG